MAGAREDLDQGSKPRGFRLRSSAGFASIGSAIALLAVSLAAFTGLGTSRSSIDLGSGFAWLSSNDVGKSQGQVVLANGATGQGVTKLNIDGVEDGEVRVEQRDGHAVVVVTSSDGTTRVLYRLDDQTLKNGVGRKVTGDDDVIRGGNRTYLVKQKLGTIQPIDSDTLQPKGRSIEYNTPILAAADDDGLLIVVQKDRAVYTVVTDDQATGERSLGASGDSFQISTIGGRPVVVNQTRNEVYVFRKGAPTKIAMPAGAGETLVAESGEGNVLAVLRRDNGNGTLVLVNLDKNEAKQAAVPGDASTFDAPLVAPDAVYLVDPQKGNVVVIDPTNGAVRAQKALPTGRGGNNTDTFVKDGYLWINNPNDQKAVVFDRDGNSKDVDKYRKDIPVINPVAADEPAPDQGDSAPRPVPAPEAPRRSNPVPNGDPTSGPVDGSPTGPARPTTTVSNDSNPPPTQVDPTPPAAIGNKPGAPGIPTVSALDAAATVSWSAVGGADRYAVITYAGDGSEAKRTGSDDPSCDQGTRTCTIRDLTNDASYSFEVFASNSIGDGPNSPRSATVTPKHDVPEAPTQADATAGDRTIAVIFPEGTKRYSDITEYIVSTDKNPAMTRTVSASSGPPYRTNLDQSLGINNGTAYKVTVVAKNAAGISSTTPAISATVTPSGKPFKIAAAPVARPAPGAATVSWTAANANGSPITGYKVSWPANPTGVTLPAGTLSYSANVGTQQTVNFTVTATNANGDSAPATSNSVVSYDNLNTEYSASRPAGTGGGPRSYKGCSPWCAWSGGFRVINNCPGTLDGPASANWSISVPQPGHYDVSIEVGDNGAAADGAYPDSFAQWSVNGTAVPNVNETNAGWIRIGAVDAGSAGAIGISANNNYCTPRSPSTNKWLYMAGVKLTYVAQAPQSSLTANDRQRSQDEIAVDDCGPGGSGDSSHLGRGAVGSGTRCEMTEVRQSQTGFADECPASERFMLPITRRRSRL